LAHRALIIEDDPVFGDVLRMKLVRDGHDVTVAMHQEEAYSSLDSEKYDFVMLDLRLPANKNDLDPNVQVGFDILDYIRDRYDRDELPVIVMTAYEETSQTAVRALRANANDYISKPFEDSPISLDEKIYGIICHIDKSKKDGIKKKRHGRGKKHIVVLKGECIEINGILVTSEKHRDILLLLASSCLMINPEKKDRKNAAMPGKHIANALKITEPTVRQYITRFRKWIDEESRRLGKGPVARDEIIRNRRDWNGYEINFDDADISLEK